MRFLAVADDFSGANDLAGRLAGEGFSAYSARSLEGALQARKPQALALSIETRLLGPEKARARSHSAWAALLQRHGAQICYQKMDSTLRGWPGEEILGLLEASSAPKIAFCAAYPRHGRSTLKGVHFVHGKRLDRTEYFKDPLSPARTYRPLQLFPKGLAVAASAAGLKKALKSPARILCFDATSDRDLQRIASSCLKAGLRHFAGSSGLGAAVAACLSRKKANSLPALPARRVILMGSVSETGFKQMAALQAAKVLNRQRQAFSSLASRAELRPGKERAQKALKALVAKALEANPGPFGAFWLLTGGHTAETFYAALGLEGNWVLGELWPGVPLCRAEDGFGKSLLCATKPGGFGDEATFIRVMTRGRA